MSSHHPACTRRALLRLTSSAAVATPLLAYAASPPSKTTLNSMVPSLSKAAVGYIDQPNGTEVCGACIWFKPPSPGSTTSHCHLVAGPISPAGWCEAWMRRSAPTAQPT